MRPADHFLSELEALGRNSASGSVVPAEDHLLRSFSRLVDPVVGREVAEDLFVLWNERFGSGPTPHWAALGYIAAFVLGDYQADSMPLDADTWAGIREAVNLGAGTMDLDTLTRLMGDLMARGAV